MQKHILDWLACPSCGLSLALDAATAEMSSHSEIRSGVLECVSGHRFPINDGVPRVLAAEELSAGSSGPDVRTDDARAIGESFGAEWEQFDYDSSRTWHETVEDRCKLFLREIDATPEELVGKVVLDAGCGNGTLSMGVSEFGCSVLAIDVSDSVTRAHAHALSRDKRGVHFAQGDLARLPVRPESMDIVYSSGVLHHNPDTRDAFRIVARALKPGGKIYIWLYHPEPGLKFSLQLKLRALLSPLPGPIKRGFVHVWVVQAMARQHLRTWLGRNDEKDRLTWRERTVDLLDIYTPRYRWMHTQDEVKAWYRELGLESVATTEVRQWGFGIVGTKPLSAGR